MKNPYRPQNALVVHDVARYPSVRQLFGHAKRTFMNSQLFVNESREYANNAKTRTSPPDLISNIESGSGRLTLGHKVRATPVAPAAWTNHSYKEYACQGY